MSGWFVSRIGQTSKPDAQHSYQQDAGIVPVRLTGVVSPSGKEGRMKPPIVSSEPAGRDMRGAILKATLIIMFAFLTLALSAPTRSQEEPSSIVQAARNARERQSDSSNPPKIYTNDDFSPQSLLPSALAESSPKQAAAAPTPQTADCNNADDERVKGEIQAAQEELDQLRQVLNSDPKVISDGDVDMKNFKPGSSGLAMGSPALLQTEPQAPGRVQEVMLEERIKSLKEASRIACDSPEDAEIQGKVDSAEQQLKLLQRQLELDQSTYYSKTNYSQDSSGKARLDAEQQQIESLQSEIERLRNELSVPKTNQTAE
jgi:hypothetical protein